MCNVGFFINDPSRAASSLNHCSLLILQQGTIGTHIAIFLNLTNRIPSSAVCQLDLTKMHMQSFPIRYCTGGLWDTASRLTPLCTLGISKIPFLFFLFFSYHNQNAALQFKIALRSLQSGIIMVKKL